MVDRHDCIQGERLRGMEVVLSGLGERIEEVRGLLLDMRSRYDRVLLGDGVEGFSGRLSRVEERVCNLVSWLRWFVPVLVGYMLFIGGVVLRMVVGGG